MGRHTIDDQIEAYRKALRKKFGKQAISDFEGLIISWILKAKGKEGI